MSVETIEELFREQLRSREPFTKDSPQVVKCRKDFFGLTYQPGDTELHVAFRVNHGMNIVSVNNRSLDRLNEYFEVTDRENPYLPIFSERDSQH